MLRGTVRQTLLLHSQYPVQGAGVSEVAGVDQGLHYLRTPSVNPVRRVRPALSTDKGAQSRAEPPAENLL